VKIHFKSAERWWTLLVTKKSATYPDQFFGQVFILEYKNLQRKKINESKGNAQLVDRKTEAVLKERREIYTAEDKFHKS